MVSQVDNWEMLLSNSTKVIVQTPEEFLQTFSIEDFENSVIINGIKNRIVPSNRIGTESAVGSVYNVPGKNYVIKYANYCPPNVAGLKKQLCDMVKNGDLVFRIPNTQTDTTTVFAPNYLLEPIIGILLANDTRNYTPSFMKIYGFQYDTKNASTYTIMEKLSPLDQYVKTQRDFIYMIFQATHALSVAQQLGRFTHWDLHAQNVMCRPTDNSIKVYPIGNGKYLYTKFNFDVVLIDYGHCRYESGNMVISPRMNFVTGSRNMLDYYFFNPYYDLFSLLYNSVTSYKNVSAIEKIAETLFELFVNKPTNTSWQDFLNYVGIKNYWRPQPEKLMTEIGDMDWYNVCDPIEYLARLATLIENSTTNNIKYNGNNKREILNILTRDNMWVSDQIIDFGPNTKTTVLPPVPTDQVMDLTYYNYRFKNTDSFLPVTIKSTNKIPNGVRTSIMPFNYTLSNQLRINNTFNYNISDDWIHTAVIDQNGGSNNGYSFKFECCRVDLRNYFQREKIGSGIAINASFFNFNNYEPIGFFKTGTLEIDNPIPSAYKNYYAIVGIDKLGKLKIDSYGQRFKYEQVISSGPVLVKNGSLMITESLLATDQRFGCRLAKRGEKQTTVFRDNVLNCNGQATGGFFHASNPNPRTALITKKDGTVVFVYVEGRDQRGPGMDLAQLGQLCIQLGADYAINLDGGQSSQFLWKKPGESIIYQTNPTHDQSYPVGSIIAYTKTH